MPTKDDWTLTRDPGLRLYILNGREPVRCEDTLEWGKQYGRADTRRVGEDFIYGLRISTVFLALDHNFHGGYPILFETMVFADDGGGSDIYVDRYRTWDEAELGHEAVCKLVRDKKITKDNPYSD